VIEYAKYQFYFNIFQFALTCLVAIGAWWRTREKADSTKLTAASQKLERQLTDASLKQEKLLIDAKALRDEQCRQHKDDTAKIILRVDGHNDRLSQHKELLNTVETELKHLPKNTDIARLHEKVNTVSAQMSDLKAEIGKIAGAMPGLTNITTMMNDFLLHHGGKE